ncbi:MAG: hypothetical protein KBS68_06555 [Clostridiales bacterium]|nr:hypothetical protein [Candidatus Crickella merdequi]
MIKSSGSAVVDAMADYKMDGHRYCFSWFKEITFEGGKPDFLAILILADCVYWHRPTEIKDENGMITGYKRKFSGRYLQRNYEQLEIAYNASRKQVKRAVDNLVDIGVIQKEFRTLKRNGKVIATNVMYLTVVPEKLQKITYEVDPYGLNAPIEIEGDPYLEGTTLITPMDYSDDFEVKGVEPEMNILPSVEVQTNTNNTTEIKTNNSSSLHQVREEFRKKIEYEILLIDLPRDKRQIDELIEVAVEALMADTPKIKVGSELKDTVLVKERLNMLDIDSMKSVVEKIKSISYDIYNPKAYMLTLLLSEAVTSEITVTTKVNQLLCG